MRVRARLLVVCAVFGSCLLLSGIHPPGSRDAAAALRSILCAYALPACFAVVLARRVRGHTRAADALHALAWLHPWQLELVVRGHALAGIAASAAASILVLGATVGFRSTIEGAVQIARPLLRPRVLVLAVLCLLLWLARAELPTCAFAGDLDASWMQAASHAFVHGLQAGRDWTFTCGPLGCFHTPVYQHELFWTSTIVWECVVKLSMAVLLTLSVSRLCSVIEQAACFALMLFLPVGPDSYAFLALLAATAWILDRPAPDRPVVHYGLALFAVLALTKFTVLLLSITLLGLILFAAWRASSARSALILFGVWAAAGAAAWLLSGQQLGTLVPYLSGAWELSSGYSAAMSIPARAPELVAAATAAAGAVLVAGVHGLSRPRSIARAAGSLALLAACSMAFKAGFTRGDALHVLTFFAFGGAAPFLLGDRVGAGAAERWLLRAGRALCATAAVWGVVLALQLDARGGLDFLSQTRTAITRNADAFLDLRGLQQANERSRAILQRQAGLPRVRATVGRASIDMVNYRQSLLLLNDLNWKPRPSVQGYCAFTPRLLQANADHFRGADAPEYVLFELKSIDGRIQPMEDNQVLEILLCDYRPLFAERSFVLLHREPRPDPPPPRETLMDRTMRFGERVELDGAASGCQLLALDIQPSLRGRLWTMLYGAPPLHLEVEIHGAEVQYVRIVPAMMRFGVIINPVLRDTADIVEWSNDGALPRITGIRLDPGDAWMYEPEVGMRLIGADDLKPAWPRNLLSVQVPLADALAPASEPAITPTPENIDSDRPVHTIDGPWSTLVVHAPSRTTIVVPPGRHRLRGRFGFASPARRAPCNAAVVVRVVLEDGDARSLLHERTLDAALEEDMDEHEVDVTFEARGSARLQLSTVQSGAGTECAWTFWRRVRLE